MHHGAGAWRIESPTRSGAQGSAKPGFSATNLDLPRRSRGFRAAKQIVATPEEEKDTFPTSWLDLGENMCFYFTK